MNKLFSFLCITIFFMACSVSKQTDYSNNLSRQWMLKKMYGFSYDTFVSVRARIDLQDLEKPAAYAGCNNIFFKIDKHGIDKITFSNIGSTRMYCEKYMSLENAYIKNLELVKQYNIKGHQLILKDRNNKVLMELIAADWD